MFTAFYFRRELTGNASVPSGAFQSPLFRPSFSLCEGIINDLKCLIVAGEGSTAQSWDDKDTRRDGSDTQHAEHRTTQPGRALLPGTAVTHPRWAGRAGALINSRAWVKATVSRRQETKTGLTLVEWLDGGFWACIRGKDDLIHLGVRRKKLSRRKRLSSVSRTKKAHMAPD